MILTPYQVAADVGVPDIAEQYRACTSQNRRMHAAIESYIKHHVSCQCHAGFNLERVQNKWAIQEAGMDGLCFL